MEIMETEEVPVDTRMTMRSGTRRAMAMAVVVMAMAVVLMMII